MIKTDQEYIQRCFELALKAKGEVSPNPLVGSVIVEEGKIISEGYHKKSGTDHAELDAIKNAKASIEGATLYCNLEPCCHTNKKTAPCAQRIIKEKIKKVIISNLDPNPQVAGQGVKLLESAGIEVTHGVLKEEGEKLNEIFFHHILKKTPFIHLKIAQTLDGFTATESGESKWITGCDSRKNVHMQREFYDGILIGANTARLDNPTLTVRIGDDEKPIKRFILSTTGELPDSLNLFNDKFKDYTYLVLPEGTKTNINVNTIYSPATHTGEIDLNILCSTLYKDHQVTSIFIEGGANIHSKFIKEKLYNRVSFYIAPKIFGEGNKSISNIGVSKISEAIELHKTTHKQFGEDSFISGLRQK